MRKILGSGGDCHAGKSPSVDAPDLKVPPISMVWLSRRTGKEKLALLLLPYVSKMCLKVDPTVRRVIRSAPMRGKLGGKNPIFPVANPS